MALAKVLSFIQHNIATTKKDLNGHVQKLLKPGFFTYLSDGNNFIYILTVLRNAIEESQCGSDLEKIKQAISLIQQIRFKEPGEQPKYFADYAAERGYRLLVPFEESDRFDPLKYNHKAYEEVFGQIYQTLTGYLNETCKLNRNCKWQHSLSSHNSQEIMNDQVADWQKSLTKLYDKNTAYADFRRGTSFGVEFPSLSSKNLSTLSDDELTKALTAFIKDAKAYPEEDAQLLLQWMQNNGGQYNSRFIDMMLMNHCIIDIPIAPGVSKPNTQHWYISRSGKICLNLDFSYYSLLQEGRQCTLFLHIRNAKKHSPGDADLGELIDDPYIASGTPRSRKPVMRVNAILELSVESADDHTKVVVPHVVHMQVSAFTNLLKLRDDLQVQSRLKH